MRSNPPILAIGACLLLAACWNSETALPGHVADICSGFDDTREVGWESLTAQGVTPTQAMQAHATPPQVSGELGDWVDGSSPSFTFSFHADTAVDGTERYWDPSDEVPEGCWRNWRLDLPTSAQLAIDHGALPPIAGSGSVTIEVDDDAWSCFASLGTRLHDRGASSAWFDLVHEHITGTRPTAMEVYVRSACDGSEGTFFVEYQAIIDENHVAGAEFFSFGE